MSSQKSSVSEPDCAVSGVHALIPNEIARSLEGGFARSNLAFALMFLPADQRADMAEFYRFCRIVDDIADSETLAAGEKFRLLDGWLAALAGLDESESGGSMPEALADLIVRRGLDVELLAEVVRGVRMDVEPVGFRNFDELAGYCWRVAGAVGTASLPIFGAGSAESRDYARALGLALQLTNIIRDVGEDAEMGRVYLPEDLLAARGLTMEDVLRARSTSVDLAGVLDGLAASARENFDRAEACRVEADQSALKAPEAMRRIYMRLLDQMERDGYRVIEKRYKLGKLEIAKIATAVFVGG